VSDVDADIDFAIKWWEDHVEYKDVIMVTLGTPLGILEGTPLAKQFDELGLIRVGEHPEDWTNPATNNTPQKRLHWHKRIVDTVDGLGYRRIDGADNRFILERMMTNKDD
jgi:hypothetical protein